jgi:hypothetical protein
VDHAVGRDLTNAVVAGVAMKMSPISSTTRRRAKPVARDCGAFVT